MKNSYNDHLNNPETASLGKIYNVQQTRPQFAVLDTGSKHPNNDHLGFRPDIIEQYVQKNERNRIIKTNEYDSARLQGLRDALSLIEGYKLALNKDFFADITSGSSKELANCCRTHGYHLLGKLREALIAMMEDATPEQIALAPIPPVRQEEQETAQDGWLAALHDTQALLLAADPNALYSPRNEHSARRNGVKAIATMEYRIAQRILTDLYQGLNNLRTTRSVEKTVQILKQKVIMNDVLFLEEDHQNSPKQSPKGPA